MKVAVSIPDPVFAAADVLAKQLKTSRSDLYARALGDFIDRHEGAWVTQALNAVEDATSEPEDAFVTRAARNVLRQVEW